MNNAVVGVPRWLRILLPTLGGRRGRQSVGAVPSDPACLAGHEETPGWGRIINMASIYSTRSVANRIDYVTTKTAIVGMTRAVAIETTTKWHHLQCALPGDAADPGD